MRQYLLDLYEIQKIDLSIREQEKRQEAIPAHLRQLEASIDQLRDQIGKLREQRDGIVKEAKALEGNVQAEVQKIRKWEARLNEIRNQREYLALSREVEGGKRANREAEEKIAELMTSKESLDKQLEGLQSKLADLEVECEAEREKVEKALAELGGTLKGEVARRDALIPRVPKPVFRKYDAIRSKRLGVGLSPVAGGCCTGCNMKLPPQLYNILQRGDSIEQCPSCHRLIFWDQILPPSEQEATPKEQTTNGSVEASP